MTYFCISETFNLRQMLKVETGVSARTPFFVFTGCEFTKVVEKLVSNDDINAFWYTKICFFIKLLILS